MERKFNLIDFDKEKKKKYFIGLAIILVVTLFLDYTVDNLLMSFLVASFIGGVYFIRAYQWNKYYIEYLFIKNEVLSAHYYKNGTFFSVQIDLEKLKISKSLAIVSTGREPVMKISNTEGLNIFQYEIGDWSEEIMDEVIIEIKAYKVNGDSKV